MGKSIQDKFKSIESVLKEVRDLIVITRYAGDLRIYGKLDRRVNKLDREITSLKEMMSNDVKVNQTHG